LTNESENKISWRSSIEFAAFERPFIDGQTKYLSRTKGGFSYMPEGQWEVFKGKTGKFRFRLRASNGQCIAQASQSYKDKGSAMDGIQSIKNNVNSPLIDKTIKKPKPT
jgi:uncharacterized protein YegP (UPF0339 family)